VGISPTLLGILAGFRLGVGTITYDFALSNQGFTAVVDGFSSLCATYSSGAWRSVYLYSNSSQTRITKNAVITKATKIRVHYTVDILTVINIYPSAGIWSGPTQVAAGSGVAEFTAAECNLTSLRADLFYGAVAHPQAITKIEVIYNT
jgi:hypothetical protein